MNAPGMSPYRANSKAWAKNSVGDEAADHRQDQEAVAAVA